MVASRRFARLMSPQDARGRLAAVLRPAPRGTERIPVHTAVGRVLAADVVASVDLPPFSRSAVDGWAVRASDTSGATSARPRRLRQAGHVQMGSAAAAAVPPGGAVRIPTGGMLPPGADAAVEQESAQEDGPDALITRSVQAGENVVERGADVRAGETVIRRGRRLRPADLGIMAAQGLGEVEVFLTPRVAILATGDELVSPGAPLRPGQVRDSNSAALAGAVMAAGGLPDVLGIVGDDRDVVEAALRRALPAHEMVLVSGGSSVGERDVLSDAVAALGPPGIVAHGVAVRPGKPTLLAAAGPVPVIGLPGNPVSALVIFDLFARPVLEQMLGMDPESAPWSLVRARLSEALAGADAREDHRRVRLEARPDGVWATPLPPGSQILTSMVHAHGIVVVPPGVDFTQGDEVDVRLLV